MNQEIGPESIDGFLNRFSIADICDFVLKSCRQSKLIKKSRSRVRSQGIPMNNRSKIKKPLREPRPFEPSMT